MDNLCLAQETSLNVYTNYENYQGGSSHADEAIKREVNRFVRRLLDLGPQKRLNLTQGHNRIMAWSRRSFLQMYGSFSSCKFLYLLM